MKKILIIDDNESVCSMLKRLFEQRGFQIFIANDGLLGVHIARQKKPDLIILDLMLPGMDGHKVCRMIKFDQQLKNIPVVIFTSRNTERDAALAKKCGADDFVVKAKGTDKILATVEKLLNP